MTRHYVVLLWYIAFLVTIRAAPGELAKERVTAFPTADLTTSANALKADPAVLSGQLKNGLRYAILPNEIPAKRASVFLLVQAGSYQENDDELGYAHFVEHMAFRSTRDFEGDNAIKTLQRLGLSFGPHVNAQTRYFTTT